MVWYNSHLKLMLELFRLFWKYHWVVDCVLPSVCGVLVYGWVERVTKVVCLGCKGCDWDVWVCLIYLGYLRWFFFLCGFGILGNLLFRSWILECWGHFSFFFFSFSYCQRAKFVF